MTAVVVLPDGDQPRKRRRHVRGFRGGGPLQFLLNCGGLPYRHRHAAPRPTAALLRAATGGEQAQQTGREQCPDAAGGAQWGRPIELVVGWRRRLVEASAAPCRPARGQRGGGPGFAAPL